MGGEHHALGADKALAFQPLRYIDDPATRSWAAEWIATLLTHEKVTVTPEVKEAVWSALNNLAGAPVEATVLDKKRAYWSRRGLSTYSQKIMSSTARAPRRQQSREAEPMGRSLGSTGRNVYQRPRGRIDAYNISLTPKLRLWFVGRPFSGVRFALVIRRGSLAL